MAGTLSGFFIDKHYVMNDDGYLQRQRKLKTAPLSQAEKELCRELEKGIYRRRVGWMKGPDGRSVAVFGHGSPREGQPIPVKYLPRLTAKVVRRANWGRPICRGPSLLEGWRGFLYHIGKDRPPKKLDPEVMQTLRNEPGSCS